MSDIIFIALMLTAYTLFVISATTLYHGLKELDRAVDRTMATLKRHQERAESDRERVARMAERDAEYAQARERLDAVRESFAETREALDREEESPTYKKFSDLEYTDQKGLPPKQELRRAGPGIWMLDREVQPELPFEGPGEGRNEPPFE